MRNSWLVAFSSIVIVLVSGCAGAQFGSQIKTPAVSVQGAALRGKVHGGMQPISGAHVYLFAVGTGGYGGPGIAASSGNVSQSLLASAGNTAADNNGNDYVTTDSGGNFTITGDYSCPPNAQVYLYALGGNPGLAAGTNNTAAGLMAGLGSCSALLSAGSSFPPIVVNEVSTIATAYALAGFATDATHISSSGTALALQGVANAMAAVPNLEALNAGVALAITPAGNGNVPQSEINTLADVLAACINTNGAVTGGASPTTCYTLLNNALSDGATGTAPSDTATAAINIAHHPGANVSALFSLASGSPPFAPGLAYVPTDWMIVVAFTGGGLNSGGSLPQAVAIDGSGNVWVVCEDQPVVELSSTGTILSGENGFTDGNWGTLSIAIDLSGNVWLANYYSDTISKFSSSGAVLSGSGFSVGVPSSGPMVVAIDASNNAWVGSPEGHGVFKLSNTGSNLSGVDGYSGGGMGGPIGIGFDGSGNAWVASGYDVAELSSSGAILSGASGFTNGLGESSAVGMALDSAGNIWVALDSSSIVQPNGVTKLSNSGSVLFAAPNNPSSGPQHRVIGLTLDGAGNAWVTAGDALFELSSSGTLLSPGSGYGWETLEHPEGPAVDGSGNVWVPDDVDGSRYETIPNGGGVVQEIIGAAVPVITPIAAGLPATPTADGSSNLATRP